jgi:hypothetical protein
MPHEMEMEDYYLSARRELAVEREQNQLLREQNSRLTLALDEAFATIRTLRAERSADLAKGEAL